MEHTIKWRVTIAVFVFSFFISACKKEFLDGEVATRITKQEHVKDLGSATDYLNGLYIILGENFFREGVNYADLAADNIKTYTLTSSTQAAQHFWSMTASIDGGNSENFNLLWQSGYQIIRECSFLIEKADEFRDENPGKADNLKAQCLGLRALIHFTMVNVFAQPFSFTPDASHNGIPVVTSYDWAIPLHRNSVAEVYHQIISDLTVAISLFGSPPSKQIDLLYLNKAASEALLARVNLFKGDFSVAKDLATDVCTQIPLMSIASGYPSDLFKSKLPSQTEVLFQLPPSASGVSLPVPGMSSNYLGTYTTSFPGRQYNAGASSRFVATSDAANLLRAHSSDVRKSWVKQGARDTIVKFPANVVPGFPSATSQAGAYYLTLFRTSEMYLTAAECFAMLGDDGNARTYVNAIRTRAGIPVLAVTVSGPALLDSIYTERRRELAFEGFRLFDLLRWKKPVNRADFWNPTAQFLPYPNDKAIAPIPLPDVTIAGLQQNPGY